MQYWIHIFDNTSTIKLRSMESSYEIWDEAVSNIVGELEKGAASMADGKYVAVLSTSKDFKFPAAAADFVVQVKKSGSSFTII